MQTPPSSHQHHHHHHHQDEAPVAKGAASSLDKALQAISRQLSKGSGFDDSELISQSQRGRLQADPRAGLFDDDFDRCFFPGIFPRCRTHPRTHASTHARTKTPAHSISCRSLSLTSSVSTALDPEGKSKRRALTRRRTVEAGGQMQVEVIDTMEHSMAMRRLLYITSHRRRLHHHPSALAHSHPRHPQAQTGGRENAKMPERDHLRERLRVQQNSGPSQAKYHAVSHLRPKLRHRRRAVVVGRARRGAGRRLRRSPLSRGLGTSATTMR